MSNLVVNIEVNTAIKMTMKILFPYIYIFIAIALDESIFLDVLHFPMKNIKSRDLEATPMGGAISKTARDFVYSCLCDVGRVSS